MHEIAGLATQFDIFRFLKRYCVEIGCTGFYMSWMPTLASSDMSENSIITNWPAEVIQRFDSNGLMRESPILNRLQNTTAPFLYDVDELYGAKTDPRSAAARELFHSAALGCGGVFPVADALGDRAFVIFAGDNNFVSTTMLMVTHLVATHVFDRLFQIRQKDFKAAEALTDREVDCLTWTAAGKTSAEIAEILTLSEHTVNHYLNRAARKLDTVNRTQAVAKALRSGIIR